LTGLLIGISVYDTFSRMPFLNEYTAGYAMASGFIALLFAWTNWLWYIRWPAADVAAAAAATDVAALTVQPAVQPAVIVNHTIDGLPSPPDPVNQQLAVPISPLPLLRPGLAGAAASLSPSHDSRLSLLRFLSIVAWLLLTLSFVSFVFFLVIAGINQQKLSTGREYWVTAVWAFMCGKWSLGLVLLLRKVTGDPEATAPTNQQQEYAVLPAAPAHRRSPQQKYASTV
jgi:hypothetical protein